MRIKCAYIALVVALWLAAAGAANTKSSTIDASQAAVASPPAPAIHPSVAQPFTTLSWLNPLISAAAGVVGALIGGYFATRNARATIIQKTNEVEIAAIDRRISDFIAPYEQLSLENLKLSRELKRSRGDTFRTLTALLDPDWKTGLSAGDKALVDAIVNNGASLRQMILTSGGAVSTVIRPHLAAASMHFRMLSLADAGSLENDAKRYEDYVYPRQLDGALALERARLETRKELLRNKPDMRHGPIDELEIPPHLKL
jgi:hypothetical protein